MALSRYIASRNQMVRVDLDSEEYYVDTVSGSATYDGRSWSSAFLTMAAALAVVPSHAIIYVRGKIREQVIAPLGVYGVSIVGADTRPRHDLAASWLPPASGGVVGKALLELLEQGWSVSNLLMSSFTTAACVKLSRREDAAHPDASHAIFSGCRFVGVDGIVDDGGGFNVLVDGCIFQDLTGTAIKNISTTIDNPTGWMIRDNVFRANVNGIVSPLKQSTITRNVFSATTTVTINLTGGVAPNLVVDNVFDINGADFDPAGGVTGVSGDVWSNMLKDALNEHGLPAN